MPRAANATERRGESISVPGIYEHWIRTGCAWARVPDDRFLEDMPDAEYAVLIANCQAAAEEAAAERIEAAERLRGKRVRAGRMLHPWIRDYYSVPDLPMFKVGRLFDIAPDDTVTYNAEATERSQRERAETEAQRAAAAARRNTYGHNGHNGRAVTLTEVIE